MNIDKILKSIPLSASDKMLAEIGYDLRLEYLEIAAKADFLKKYEIFEFATGGGRLAAVLSRLGYNLITADISDEERVKAENRISKKYLDNVKFICADLEELSFKNDSTLQIISVNTIHELACPEKCIDEMVRINNPAGKIVISDFNELGFEVIGKVHFENYGEIHPEGNLKMPEVEDFLRSKYLRVSKFETKLNITIIAEKKYE